VTTRLTNVKRAHYIFMVITSAKKDYVIVVVCLFVRLSVTNFVQKLPNGFA